MGYATWVTVALIVVICALTCVLAVSFVLNVKQLALANHQVAERVADTQAVVGLVQSHMQRVANMQSDHAQQLTALTRSMMEQLRTTLSENGVQLREAVKIAWMPNDQIHIPQGTADKAGKPISPWVLPTPIAADESRYDDSDPTDDLLSESGFGRHQPAMIADSQEGGLIKDGKFLGVEGLVPPSGVLDDQTRQMLITQAAKLVPIPTLLGYQPSVPPGSIPTPTFVDPFTQAVL